MNQAVEIDDSAALGRRRFQPAHALAGSPAAGMVTPENHDVLIGVKTRQYQVASVWHGIEFKTDLGR